MRVSEEEYNKYVKKRMKRSSLFWIVIIVIVMILSVVNLLIKGKTVDVSIFLLPFIGVAIPIAFLLIKDAIQMKADSNTDAYIIEAIAYEKVYASMTEKYVRMVYYDFVIDSINTATACVDNGIAAKIEEGSNVSILVIQRKNKLEFVSLVEKDFSKSVK